MAADGKLTTIPRNPLHFLIMSAVCRLNAGSGSLGNPAISQYVNFSGLTHFEGDFVGKKTFPTAGLPRAIVTSW